MADTGTLGTEAPASGQATQSAPEPISLTDDSLVKLPGSEKAVKWGEHNRGFQSEFTRKAQAAKEYEAKYKTLESQARATEQKLAQLQAYFTQQQGGQAQEDPFADLKGKTYLDGETSYNLAKRLRDQIGEYDGKLSKRDQALQLIAQHLLKQEQQLNEIRGSRTEEDFNRRMQRTVKELGYDEDLTEFAKETYLAYEGEDLDKEFPTILKNRIEQLESYLNKRSKAKTEAARRLPFTPTRSGNGAATKPLSMVGKSTREIADMFFADGLDSEA